MHWCALDTLYKLDFHFFLVIFTNAFSTSKGTVTLLCLCVKNAPIISLPFLKYNVCYDGIAVHSSHPACPVGGGLYNKLKSAPMFGTNWMA